MEYLTRVEKVWNLVLEDLEKAKDKIYFEQFILKDFEEGQIGHKIITKLLKKSKEGVKVQILLDAIGCRELTRTDLYRKIFESNIDLNFTEIKYINLVKYLPWETKRNHRKLILIDDDIVHVGGVVFMEKVRKWKDFHAKIKDDTLNYRKSFKFSVKDESDDTLFGYDDKRIFNILVNGFDHKKITEEIVFNIKNAKKHITIFTPYFSVDRRLLNLLKLKSKEIPTKIYIPKVTDHIFSVFTHYYLSFKLRKSNIKFMVNDGVMNHAKVLLIDDWVTFGSCNFDYLSLYYNKELNVETKNIQEYQKIEYFTHKDFLEDPKDFYKEVYLKSSFLKRNIFRFLGSITRYIS